MAWNKPILTKQVKLSPIHVQSRLTDRYGYNRRQTCWHTVVKDQNSLNPFPLPLHSKLGCLLFITGSLNSGKTLIRGRRKRFNFTLEVEGLGETREMTLWGQSVLTSFGLDCILYILALVGPQRKRAQATKATMKVNNIALFSNFCRIRK